MLKVIAALILSFSTIFFMPFWVQLVSFFVLIFVTPYRFLLLIPAIFADIFYAPKIDGIFFAKYTVFVFVLILLHWLIVTKTRIRDLYDFVEK